MQPRATLATLNGPRGRFCTIAPRRCLTLKTENESADSLAPAASSGQKPSIERQAKKAGACSAFVPYALLQGLPSVQWRLHDYCIARDEHELHVQAIAVPIRDSHGSVLAALNLVGPPQMMKTESAAQALLKMLQESARDLRPML
ncbi:IclR family transcriptional regulator C-terminal domain-containing protein [Comamonas sp. J-3]|uniref:IclR family transcriptional regulator domain-containing protein n=1 Tax=Comamonas trifloxystrobinivorans TaxID=3350256 RepID=UPI003728882C